MGLLEGKTALVTGSGRGIGAAIAVCCAREGANVVINYLQNREKAEETLAAVQKYDCKALIVKADVRQIEEVHTLINEVIYTFNGLDILINNAHTPFQPLLLEDLTWNDILEQLEGILGSSFNCIKYAMPHLEKSSTGVVLNISSVTVRLPEKGFTHRDVAKAALESLTRNFTNEFADKGVRVNALSVGWTETDQLNNLPKEYCLAKISSIPFKRFAVPEEIADAALFLVSPLSRYVTGIVVPVAGGL